MDSRKRGASWARYDAYMAEKEKQKRREWEVRRGVGGPLP